MFCDITVGELYICLWMDFTKPCDYYTNGACRCLNEREGQNSANTNKKMLTCLQHNMSDLVMSLAYINMPQLDRSVGGLDRS